MRLTDYKLVTKEVPVGGSPVFDDFGSPYRRTSESPGGFRRVPAPTAVVSRSPGGFRRVPTAAVSRSPLPRTPRRTSPAQRKLEYGRTTPRTGRSLRERESGWAI